MTTQGVGSPAVSVVLATNALHDWLDLAVRSILTQEGVTLELIVVHDGIAVDGERAWTADPRVRCVATGQSHGLAHALTVGVEQARGDYLARLDGDDLSLPGRLAAQAAYLDAHPEVALLATAVRIVGGQGEQIGRFDVLPRGDVRSRLLTRNVLIHSSVMMRRDAYLAAGGYDSALRQMEDYVLWLELARQGEVHMLPQELTAYRVHGAQMSRGAASSGPYIDAVLRARRALAAHLGQPAPVQHVRDLAWRGVQVARHRGWRRPGYERRLARRL